MDGATEINVFLIGLALLAAMWRWVFGDQMSGGRHAFRCAGPGLALDKWEHSVALRDVGARPG